VAVQLGQLSPDGRYVWNGAQWVPTAPRAQLSPDGRWIWNGVQWIPNPAPTRRSPAGLILFRGYCIVAGLLALVIGSLGMLGLAIDGFDPAKFDSTAGGVEVATILFLYLLVEGIALGIALFLPRRPWAWIWSLIAIALGVAGITIFGAVPLMIYWVRTDMRTYYGFGA